MNPIRFLSIVLLFVLPFSADAQILLSGIQQELQVNTQANRVIANGGLRLREQPGKKSKIITTLPFGTDVVYVSQQSFGTDSILVNDTYIYGSWVKVNSQKQTGYVLDIYLVKNNQKQLLSRPDFDYPARVVFAGDIDGDGITDYVICYGDKGAIIGLYLSGQAQKGDLIRLVSFYYGGYCC